MTLPFPECVHAEFTNIRHGLVLGGKVTRKNDLSRNQIEYVVWATQRAFQHHFDAIEKRRLFTDTVRLVTDAPESASSEGFDYLMYVDNPSPTRSQWFLVETATGRKEAINFDGSLLLGPERIRSFLQSMEKAVSRTPAVVVSDEPARQSSSGTGFCIDSAGHVVTAFHVVDGAAAIKLRFQGGDWVKAQVVKHSRTNDIAVLKAETPHDSHLSFADVATQKQADKVFTLGFPVVGLLGEEPKYSEGYISALSGAGGEDTLLQVSLPVQPGNSGGPLLNKDGRIVGMVTSTAAILPFVQVTGTLPQGITWAIKGSYIRLLTKSATPIRGEAKTVEAVRKAICLIVAE